MDATVKPASDARDGGAVLPAVAARDALTAVLRTANSESAAHGAHPAWADIAACARFALHLLGGKGESSLLVQPLRAPMPRLLVDVGEAIEQSASAVHALSELERHAYTDVNAIMENRILALADAWRAR